VASHSLHQEWGQRVRRLLPSFDASIQRSADGNGATMKKIDVYKGWCKKCGICVAFCPKKVLTADKDGFPVAAHSESCTGCRWCEFHCPDFAVVVTPDKHSTEDNDD